MLPALPALRRSAAAITALACLGIAGAAHASVPVTETDYSVDAEIAAHYEHHLTPPNGEAEYGVGFTISQVIPKVTFHDKQLAGVSDSATTLGSVEATAHMEAYTPQGTVSGDCTGTKADPITGSLATSPELNPLGAERIIIRPFAFVSVPWTCTSQALSFPSGLLTPNLPNADGEGPYDSVVTLPDEAISMGRFIELVNKDVPLEQCPLKNPATVTCTLHLQGQVTFTRTAQRVVQEDAPSVDLTEPMPIEPLVTQDKVKNLLEAKGKAKLSGDGGTTSFTFTCGAGCTLVAHVYGASAGVRAAAAPPALATKRVTLAHGGTKRVTMRFGKAARRAIRRAGGIRLVLTAKPLAGGKAVTRSQTVKLPRR